MTCVARPEIEPVVLRKEEFGEGPTSPCPGIMTCRLFALPAKPAFSFSEGIEGELRNVGVSDDPEDLTDTMRGAARVTVVAGIGVVVASSRYTSDAIEDLAREGVMDCIVYCVSLFPAIPAPDATDDVAEYELSRKSPGRKNRASPSLLNGLFGGGCPERCAAGIGGTGACRLVCDEAFRFVTPGM